MGSGSRTIETMRSRLASSASPWNFVTESPSRDLSEPDRNPVDVSRDLGEELWQQLRHLVQDSAGRLETHPVRALGKDDQRNEDRDCAADRDLDDARERRGDRAFAELAPDQEHENRREWRDAEGRIDRRGDRHRGDRRHERDRLRDRRAVRNCEPHRRGVDRAHERPDVVLDRRAERSADAHLADDDRREHRPQTMQREVEASGYGEGRDAGDAHAQAVAQLRSDSPKSLAHRGGGAHGFSRQPVRKIQVRMARQATMNTPVKPRLAATLTSPWP